MGHPNEPHDPDRHPTDGLPDQAGPPEKKDPPATAEPAPTSPGGRQGSWFAGSRRVGIIAAVAGVVVGGVIGGGVGWAATGNDDSGTNGRPHDSAHSRQVGPRDGEARHDRDRRQGAADRRARGATIGTITAIDGSTWTVAARNGRTVTVDIGPGTVFGTPRVQQKQTDFVVGDRVAVVGRNNSGTVTAARVAKRAAASAAPGATSQPG